MSLFFGNVNCEFLLSTADPASKNWKRSEQRGWLRITIFAYDASLSRSVLVSSRSQKGFATFVPFTSRGGQWRIGRLFPSTRVLPLRQATTLTNVLFLHLWQSCSHYLSTKFGKLHLTHLQLVSHAEAHDWLKGETVCKSVQRWKVQSIF